MIDRSVVDDRVRALLVAEHAQVAEDALRLEGVDVEREIRQGIDALGGHHGYHSTARLRTRGARKFRGGYLRRNSAAKPAMSLNTVAS